jgi:hypothetical protein
MADVHNYVLVVQYMLDKRGNSAFLDYCYYNMLYDNPERSFHLLHVGSLKSHLDKQVCCVLV